MEEVKVIQVEMTEDDEIMVDVIDKALDYLDKYGDFFSEPITVQYLDKYGDFFSEPITVQDMRDWLKSKLPSKYV